MKLEICTVSKNVDHTCNFAMSWYFATCFHESWSNSIIRTTYKLQLIFSRLLFEATLYPILFFFLLSSGEVFFNVKIL